MDFAVFIGEEKTLIFQKKQGIVLNEPSLLALKNEKVVAVGKTAVQLIDDPDIVFKQVVRRNYIVNIDYASVFMNIILKKVGTMCKCIICIPSSLDQEALNDYKSVVYTAGVADAVFVPSVIANAYATDYDINSQDEFLSIVIDGEYVDMAVIRGGEIIGGGTLYSMQKFEQAKKQLISTHKITKQFTGDRISVVNGAGALLSKQEVVKKIIELN